MEKAEAKCKPVLLGLFSGTGSIGKAFRVQGWGVVSVDIDPSAQADITMDIMLFEVSKIGAIDAIWASPPCTSYSMANRSKVNLTNSDELVKKTLSIAEEVGCPFFVENPWTGQLKTRGLLDHLKMHRVDYCKYGMPYRKRTAIWTNTDWKPSRPLCAYDCAATIGKKHSSRAQQGPPGVRYTQRQLYVIPDALCEEIADFVNETTCLY